VEILRAAVFLIGNVARDEAAQLQVEVEGREAPAAREPERAPAPEPPPPPAPPALHRLWVGVAFEGDLMNLRNATDVCLLDPRTGNALNGGTYECANADGSDFPARGEADPQGKQNASIKQGASDRVAGGLAPTNVRVMASVDYALTESVLVGGRLGYTFNRYPGSAQPAFGPLHLEARVTYLAAAHPLTEGWIAPAFVAGMGLGEWSAAVPVTVINKDTNQQGQVNAWAVAGPFFVAAGAGVRIAAGDRVAVLALPLRGAWISGTSTSPSAVALAPEIGVAVGF
jgi:hypothetical protein